MKRANQLLNRIYNCFKLMCLTALSNKECDSYIVYNLTAYCTDRDIDAELRFQSDMPRVAAVIV